MIGPESIEQARLEGAKLVGRTVAHELNTALSPVVGFASLLAELPEISGNPPLARLVSQIIEWAGRTAALTKRYGLIEQLVEDPTTASLGPDYSTLDMKKSIQPTTLKGK